LIKYLGFTKDRGDFIILTGRQTSDGDTAHVPSQVAENMGIAQATFVDGVLLNGDELIAKRIIEGGHQILKLKLPSLVSFTPTATPLRRASLIETIRARDKSIKLLTIDDISLDANRVGLRGSPTIVSKVKTVKSSREAVKMAEGDNLIELVNSLIIDIKSKGFSKKVNGNRGRRDESGEDEALDGFEIVDFRDGARGVLTWAEVIDGKLSRASLEILTPARELADRLGDGTEVKSVLIGKDIYNLSRELIEHGSNGVIVVDNELLEEYQILPFASIFGQIIERYRPEIVIFPASIAGRELAPRVGVKVNGGVTADCTELRVGRHINRRMRKIYSPLLEAIRPTYGDSKLATIIGFQTPQIATVRAGTFRVPSREVGADGSVEKFSPNLNSKDFITKIVESTRGGDGLDEILKADVVVGAGRGAREDELQLIKALAKALKRQGVSATWAVSRAVVDEKLAPYERQIGQTGKIIRPKVYIAIGISGSIQHMAGVKDAERIIAINRKSSEPIFNYAEFGVAGEYMDILPLIIDKVNNGFTFGIDVE